MNEVTTVVDKQSKQKCETVKCSKNETIQRYYGQIGIPAVAAAVRHQEDFKNPERTAYSPGAVGIPAPLTEHSGFGLSSRRCSSGQGESQQGSRQKGPAMPDT
jgi:hypothetical protein